MSFVWKIFFPTVSNQTETLFWKHSFTTMDKWNWILIMIFWICPSHFHVSLNQSFNVLPMVFCARQCHEKCWRSTPIFNQEVNPRIDFHFLWSPVSRWSKNWLWEVVDPVNPFMVAISNDVFSLSKFLVHLWKSCWWRKLHFGCFCVVTKH